MSREKSLKLSNVVGLGHSSSMKLLPARRVFDGVFSNRRVGVLAVWLRLIDRFLDP
jgi:hypothetical protein